MGWRHTGSLHCVCVWYTMYASSWGHLLVFLAFLLCDDGKKDCYIYFITTNICLTQVGALTSCKRVLCYLKGTRDVLLVLGGNPTLHAYSNADFAGDRDDRKLTGAYIFGSREL